MKIFRIPWFLWCIGAGLTILLLIWAAYRLNWSGTGFQGKTIWDWLSLLIVPLALALVALLFNQANTRSEQKIAQQRYEQDQQIALDKQREDLLQAYLDRMSELLLKEKLRTSEDGSEVRNVARTRTIGVLRQLDIRRIRDVFVFLKEAGLTDESGPVVSLRGADLSSVKWSGADLSEINLNRPNLSKADLRGAIFYQADLRGAIFYQADLRGAFLHGADLREADLREAILNFAEGRHKASFAGANLSGAFLLETMLLGANFAGANLRGAFLYKTFLSKTDLSGADLRGADLGKANLSGANLSGARLKDAKIEKSQLAPEQIAQAIWN